jgi:hypothetical protein
MADAAAETPPAGPLALYCPDERQLIRLQTRVLTGERLLATTQWSRFAESASLAATAVVVMDWLAHDGLVMRLAALRARLPLLPLILVTRRDADNLRLLSRLSIEEVIFSDEVDRALPAAVLRARGAGVPQGYAELLSRHQGLPPRIRKAAAAALQSRQPLTTLEELAAAVDCDRGTLWRSWRRCFEGEPPLRLQDFLNWVLLLRAIEARSGDTSWQVVALRLGVHEHTLGRIARRLTGARLRDLELAGQQFVLDRFEASVLRPLLETGYAHAS